MGRAVTWGSAAFLAIGGFLFGYDSGIITSTISVPEFERYFNNPSDDTVGGIVSAFQGGAMLGTIINMLFAHKLGRKMTIFYGATVGLVGAALQGGAAAMAMLIIGRFIGGVSVGMLTSTIPMYAAELSEAKYRGLLSGLLQWFLSMGFLVAQWLGYGFTFLNGPVQWRFPLAFQCLPALTLMSGIWFLQESPRWLVERDRHEEARSALFKLRDDGTTDTEHLIELELKEIIDVVAADRAANQTSWKTIFIKASWRKRLLLGCGVQAFGPLSGINVINYYGPRIYEIINIGVQESLLIVGISGGLSVIYCTIMLLTLDKIGRVKPLIISAFGLASALLANAVMGQYINGAPPAQLRSMVAMNFVFSLFYTPLGVISWVYPAEIFPVQVRALGNAITTFTNWTINLIFAQFSPGALTSIEVRYFYVFFVFNVIAFVCYILFYPETKGRTLEQMDQLFGDDLVVHALQDPEGAMAQEKKNEIERVETREA
ncbi:hypothetical protein KVT40_000398 [Elsinoe batatas]|uniref:Major facilitator superfamily (MFS) profile domain-containing protein n=1 Tax=Elsinoe batatas TaxID=2601811 RepID=A0A8K0PL40_9PEZI|nr:hypothetical protein KVT40_000398 [Elsinoe batatas]